MANSKEQNQPGANVSHINKAGTDEKPLAECADSTSERVRGNRIVDVYHFVPHLKKNSTTGK